MSLASTSAKTRQFYKKFQEDPAAKKICIKNWPDDWRIRQEENENAGKATNRLTTMVGSDKYTGSRPQFLSQGEGKRSTTEQIIKKKFCFTVKVAKKGAKAHVFSFNQ